jgi:prolyl-tRNA synthetase
MDYITATTQKLTKEITHDLKVNAEAWMNEHIFRVDSLSQAKSLLSKRAGIIEVPCCGKDQCGHDLEEKLEARLLGYPEESTKRNYGNCLVCGKKAVNIVRVALAY